MTETFEFIPEFSGSLRKHMLNLPEEIRQCKGIRLFGKRIKSIIFTTDVAIIRNSNADAVIAVYPFTPQPIITQALMMAADIPVFCGVGGGLHTKCCSSPGYTSLGTLYPAKISSGSYYCHRRPFSPSYFTHYRSGGKCYHLVSSF